jgi:hypothetical protein
MPILLQLEAVAKMGTRTPYHNIEHFVLLNGRPFRPAPFPKGMRRCPLKSCFGNSHRLAERKRLIYVEGYAVTVTGGLAVLHAWCCDDSGAVIDPTWGQGSEYFGVPLDLPYVRQNTSNENMSVLDQWERQWPIFNDPPEQWSTRGRSRGSRCRGRSNTSRHIFLDKQIAAGHRHATLGQERFAGGGLDAGHLAADDQRLRPA